MTPASNVLVKDAEPEAKPSSLARSQRRNSVVTSLSNLMVVGLGVLTGPLIARSVGDVGRAEIASVIVPAQLAIWVLPLGFTHAVSYYSTTEDRKKLLSCMWAWTLFVIGPIALLLALLSPSFLRGHPTSSVRSLQAGIGVALLLMPANACFEMALIRRGSTAWLNVLQNIGSLVSAAATIVMALLGRLSVVAVLSIFILTNLVQALVLLVVNDGWARPHTTFALMQKMFRFGWKVAVFSTSGLVVARLDQLLMVNRVLPANLGHYAVAVSISSLSGPVAFGIGQAMVPVVMRGKNSGERTAGTAAALRWTASASTFIAASMALTAHWIVPLAYGRVFEKAVVPLLLLLPGQVFSDIAQVRAVAASAAGSPGVATTARVISSLVTVVLIVPAIRLHGINGAAVVTTVSNLVYLVTVFAGAGYNNRARPRHAQKHSSAPGNHS